MKFYVKIQFSAFFLAILQNFVLSDNEFYNKCPEFNPQNELDIELVSFKSSRFSVTVLFLVQNFTPAIQKPTKSFTLQK